MGIALRTVIMKVMIFMMVNSGSLYIRAKLRVSDIFKNLLFNNDEYTCLRCTIYSYIHIPDAIF